MLYGAAAAVNPTKPYLISSLDVCAPRLAPV